jgi:ATP-dependent RNA helicase DDX46/PRP5
MEIENCLYHGKARTSDRLILTSLTSIFILIFTNIDTISITIGGAGVAEQIADLKRGSEIVVCTPGRMIDILCMQAGKLVSLRRVTMVVMDEADRMFDMGFEPQIKMIIQNVRPDRQTILFSATFPKQIEKLAKTVLKLPLEIIVGERSTVNKDITQYIEVHEEEDKFLRLLQLLGVWYEKGSVLIFVDKQEKCDQLFQELLKLGYPCLSLHGGKDQVDRDHTLHEFKTGIKTVMIATSVAGRGLDVPEIVCVINFNCPNHLEDYVHRVGRTGRAGRKGTAYTFISSKEEQYAPIMVKALQKAGQEIPAELATLAGAFKEKVDRGEAHYVGSGFVGKGFTFDASEMNEAQKIAAMQRKAYEIEQGLIPENDVDLEEEDFDEEGAASKTTSAATAPAGGTAATSATATTSSSAVPTTASGVIDAQAALAKARLIAQQLLTRGIDGQEPSIGSFSEELDINDYPPQARRKVTNRNTMDDIMYACDVSIVPRGTYVHPGKKLEPGERRLYLHIIGTSEMNVRRAMMELQNILEEETLKLSASNIMSSSAGRYSVV